MISNYDKQVDIGRKIFLNYDQEALIQKYTLLMLTFYISPIWEQNAELTVRLVPLMR